MTISVQTNQSKKVSGCGWGAAAAHTPVHFHTEFKFNLKISPTSCPDWVGISALQHTEHRADYNEYLLMVTVGKHAAWLVVMTGIMWGSQRRLTKVSQCPQWFHIKDTLKEADTTIIKGRMALRIYAKQCSSIITLVSASQFHAYLPCFLDACLA